MYLSCGFGSREQSYSTAAEKVVVPAGTFDAVRVDITEHGVLQESIWIARGKGIVKIKQFSRVIELVKLETK